MARAWSCYDQLLSDERVHFIDEPANLEASWRRFSARRSSSPKVWNEAYLAAFARAGDLALVTFDRGLAAYASVAVTVLSTSSPAPDR